MVYFYSNEVQQGYQFTYEEMEENKIEFIKSMEDSKKMGENNMVALKVSAVGCFESLKVWNVCENNLLQLFKNIDKNSSSKILIKDVGSFYTFLFIYLA